MIVERKYFFYIFKHSEDHVTITVNNVVPGAVAYKTYIPIIYSRIDIIKKHITHGVHKWVFVCAQLCLANFQVADFVVKQTCLDGYQLKKNRKMS